MSFQPGFASLQASILIVRQICTLNATFPDHSISIKFSSSGPGGSGIPPGVWNPTDMKMNSPKPRSLPGQSLCREIVPTDLSLWDSYGIRTQYSSLFDPPYAVVSGVESLASMALLIQTRRICAIGGISSSLYSCTRTPASASRRI
jgi:hypothetical protein